MQLCVCLQTEPDHILCSNGVHAVRFFPCTKVTHVRGRVDYALDAGFQFLIVQVRQAKVILAQIAANIGNSFMGERLGLKHVFPLIF